MFDSCTFQFVCKLKLFYYLHFLLFTLFLQCFLNFHFYYKIQIICFFKHVAMVCDYKIQMQALFLCRTNASKLMHALVHSIYFFACTDPSVCISNSHTWNSQVQKNRTYFMLIFIYIILMLTCMLALFYSWNCIWLCHKCKFEEWKQIFNLSQTQTNNISLGHSMTLKLLSCIHHSFLRQLIVVLVSGHILWISISLGHVRHSVYN